MKPKIASELNVHVTKWEKIRTVANCISCGASITVLLILLYRMH